MPRYLGRAICLAVLSTLAACKPPAQPVSVAQFVPAAPSKPTDRAPICAHSDEVNAVHVIGLQTQLMEIALSCNGNDQYDAFVRKFQPQLAAQRTVLKGYFDRAYGRYHSQAEYDEYVTQLADAESDYNLKSGGDFCGLTKDTMVQAQDLSSSDDLAAFVAKVPVQQSMNFETCGAPGAPPVVATEAKHTYYRRTHVWYHHKKKD